MKLSRYLKNCFLSEKLCAGEGWVLRKNGLLTLHLLLPEALFTCVLIPGSKLFSLCLQPCWTSTFLCKSSLSTSDFWHAEICALFHPLMKPAQCWLIWCSNFSRSTSFKNIWRFWDIQRGEFDAVKRSITILIRLCNHAGKLFLKILMKQFSSLSKLSYEFLYLTCLSKLYYKIK